MSNVPVTIIGGGENNKGLPRPIALDAEGVGRPVPYTNSTRWGVINEDRVDICEDNSMCLVCGEPVEHGKVFVDETRFPKAPLLITHAEVSKFAADNGPLHTRCAKLTVAHCQNIRDRVRKGKMYIIDYERQSADINA